MRWILPIVRKEMKLVEIAKVCPHGKRSLERWARAYREKGEEGLTPLSTKPRTNPRETPIRIKERIIELRNKNGKCARKLCWDLEGENIAIHERTIGKILKHEGLTRRYRTRKITYRYVRVPLRAGELMEIDVKYVPESIENKDYFQYTAIDVATRWRYLAASEEQSNYHAICFLDEVTKIFPHRIRAVKTDNHSTFTNRYTGYAKSANPAQPRIHVFDQFCRDRGIIHYLIDPGKPQQNPFVERSHRSDQESFYDAATFRTAEELRYKMHLWNLYYNDLRHCGLNGKTPNQMVESG